MDRDKKITLLSAFFLSLVSIGMIVAFFIDAKPAPAFTHLYLKENSYSDTIDHGTVFFSFVLENNELAGEDYEVEYFLGTIRIGTETAKVAKGSQAEFSRVISTTLREPILPLKFTVIARNSFGKTYNVWFWLRDANYN